MRAIKNKLPANILRSLYLTLVNPYYEYCVGGQKHSCLAKTITQKTAVQMIANSTRCAHSNKC